MSLLPLLLQMRIANAEYNHCSCVRYGTSEHNIALITLITFIAAVLLLFVIMVFVVLYLRSRRRSAEQEVREYNDAMAVNTDDSQNSRSLFDMSMGARGSQYNRHLSEYYPRAPGYFPRPPGYYQRRLPDYYNRSSDYLRPSYM